MTAVQPGRDGEVCQDCGRPAHGHEFQASGLCQRCLNGPLPVRPAAPSEPPSEACRHLTWTLDFETGAAHCPRCGVAWVETQRPAEAQQDDELLAEGRRLVYNVLTLPEEHQVEVGADMIARSLAARPSADTETLRALADRWSLLCIGVPARGSYDNGLYVGLLQAARELRAALDGDQ